MSRRRCKCCNPCTACPQQWLSTTITLSGFTSNHRLIRPKPGVSSVYAKCCIDGFNLTGLNGSYVLLPGSWGSAPVCGGRYAALGSLTLGTAQNCATAGEYNFSDGTGPYLYSLDISRANNGTEIVKLLVGVGSGGTVTGASAIVWATINADEACCEVTPAGFAKFTVMTISSPTFGSIDGKLCTPFFVSATRTFKTSPTTCTRSFITQDGSDLITQIGDNRIPQ